ncbi:hypothetical protein KIV63_gp25 [Mycobacterium phage SWU2]|uniref:Uncharacterized protein n=1 Tax=Mycobacterium phage SWU2 TaxID=2077150 RepID=A0A2K9VI80_9CAUD|nr:hypothetical protein KIV63_gp25 [Mycobacterium phage SWU2]AUV62019.1 hypothetical protein JX_gp60 [Mycobacterium phage SWU2]
MSKHRFDQGLEEFLNSERDLLVLSDGPRGFSRLRQDCKTHRSFPEEYIR